MTSTDVLIMLAELLGGLAFFLYGMSAMSGGLEQMAGGKLERTLKKVTSKDFLGFLTGAGVTIAIQSSSAMTVMLVGLVNSGILNFADTFGMIMGSHVGTTLTSWILTLSGISGDNFFLILLKPMTFAPILAFVGIVMRMLSDRERKKNIGLILIGFAVLMVGMDMMSNSMSGFRSSETFKNLLVAFESPAVAFIVATVFTGIIQSSAATVAIVQAIAFAAFTTSNPITYQIAIPLVAGANVGTCMTALISSIGTNREAKRVVAMHIYTNAIGGVVCVALMYVAGVFIPEALATPVSIVGVAVIHTLFNIINTVAFTPFKHPMIKLCQKTIKNDKSKEHTVFLDERIFNNTPLAISECRRLLGEMAEHTKISLDKSLMLIESYNSVEADEVRKLEALTDKYEDKLGTYLVRISSGELSAADSHLTARMIHAISDFERISDHALNITELAEEINSKQIVFSDDAMAELKLISNALKEIVDITFKAFAEDDYELASKVEPLEQVIDKLKDELKARHVERLQSGICTIKMGFVFSDLLTNFERISDHCSNLGVYTVQINMANLDTHKYLGAVKSSGNTNFENAYKEYESKYRLKDMAK